MNSRQKTGEPVENQNFYLHPKFFVFFVISLFLLEMRKRFFEQNFDLWPSVHPPPQKKTIKKKIFLAELEAKPIS